MLFAEVERVLDELAASCVRHWVSGGWGVATLVGRQTREHRDLDLAVDAADLEMCLEALQRLGYRRETDSLPVRVEYARPGCGWVDVHPVAFDPAGCGRQSGPGDEHFDYPPGAFTQGELAGRTIPCLSVAQQRAFHAGYEPRPQDLHDLHLLDELRD